jgi:hypothetical protein
MALIPDPALVFFRPWLVASLPDLVDVIYQHQSPASAGRPDKPYATMLVTVDRQATERVWQETTKVEDMDPGSPTFRLFVRRREVKRIGTIRINLFGEDSYQRARDLQISLTAELTFATLAPDGKPKYALNNLGTILNLTGLRETEWDPNAQVDFRFMLIQEAPTEHVAVIETVNVPLNPPPP